jgi:ribosomal protein S12
MVYMTEPTNPTDYIVDKLAAIGGVMRADITVSEETVTAYIPTDQLQAVQELENVDIEVIEDYDHEQLISATSVK